MDITPIYSTLSQIDGGWVYRLTLHSEETPGEQPLVLAQLVTTGDYTVNVNDNHFQLPEHWTEYWFVNQAALDKLGDNNCITFESEPLSPNITLDPVFKDATAATFQNSEAAAWRTEMLTIPSGTVPYSFEGDCSLTLASDSTIGQQTVPPGLEGTSHAMETIQTHVILQLAIEDEGSGGIAALYWYVRSDIQPHTISFGQTPHITLKRASNEIPPSGFWVGASRSPS